jgi:hypothetical protein
LMPRELNLSRTLVCWTTEPTLQHKLLTVSAERLWRRTFLGAKPKGVSPPPLRS